MTDYYSDLRVEIRDLTDDAVEDSLDDVLMDMDLELNVDPKFKKNIAYIKKKIIDKRAKICENCTNNNFKHCIIRYCNNERRYPSGLESGNEGFCMCSDRKKIRLLQTGKCKEYKSNDEAELQFAALGIN